MSTEKKNFSRREWLMIIAIFLMAEAWILNISYSFNGEQSVINYVSFASTITSLILAVLAIVYGFYQSETGKKSNAALEAHIDAMKKTQMELDGFVVSVEGQLVSVNESARKLESVGANLSASVNKIDDLKNEISHIKEEQRQGNENIKDVAKSLRDNMKLNTSSYSKNSTTAKGFDEIFNSIFNNATFSLSLMSVLLNEAYEAKYKGGIIELALDKFAEPVSKFIQSANEDELKEYSYLRGQTLRTLGRSVIDILFVLNALGLINEKDEVIEFSSEYFDELKKHAERVKNNKHTKKVAEIIANSFKDE